MTRLIIRLWRMPLGRKLMIVEALASTFVAWVLIRHMPYSLWRSTLGVRSSLSMVPSEFAHVGLSGDRILRDIAWTHDWLARVFSRHFTCLMLALSARAMLRRRELPSVLLLGVRLGGRFAAEKLDAHAWVLSGRYEIVGGRGRQGHTPVAVYADTPRKNSLVSGETPT